MKSAFTYSIFTFLLLFSLSVRAQPSAFDISGTVKTVEKKEDREMDLPRGDVEIQEDAKVLEITVRRMTPTVSGSITVRWVVIMKDIRGNLKPVTAGQQNIEIGVGIPAKLESDVFSLKTANFDFRKGNDGKMEQEVEGYAVFILDEKGKELGSKFQPQSLEDKIRTAMDKPEQEKEGGDKGKDLQRRKWKNKL